MRKLRTGVKYARQGCWPKLFRYSCRTMSNARQTMRVGIIGGGLMGREAASAFGRWLVLDNFPVQSGRLGRMLEIRSGFWHASDLDPNKPINWKRQTKTCGEIGVMGDLGMHVVHVPFRLGWRPLRVYAQLQKIYTERPDGKGGLALCDTWDNAMLHTDVLINGEEIPMRLETKRLAPGETNTWFIEVLGTEGGARFSTKEPKTLCLFELAREQMWQRINLGHQM